MFRFSILLLSYLLVTSASKNDLDDVDDLWLTMAKNRPISRQDLIATINARATTWTAGENPLPSQLYMTNNGVEESPGDRLPVERSKRTGDELPANFDARERWPNCPSLRHIRNQGCCGSCYAVAAAAAMSDRWCIHSNETERFTFSAMNVVSCCARCGDCQEGFPGRVWRYWQTNGVVSGGEFNSSSGCHPYPVDECRPAEQPGDRPACQRECRSGYPVGYDEDKRYGRTSYQVNPTENDIMRNIFENGPVTAVFAVFSDFFSYRSGVYQLTVGHRRGSHVVKIFGWGVQGETKYWLAANSWGSEWGDNGFFRFLRGENHLGIESNVHGGLPRYDD